MDPQLKSYLGMCTAHNAQQTANSKNGDEQDDAMEYDVSKNLASQNLVFMVVGLDPKWIYPIG